MIPISVSVIVALVEDISVNYIMSSQIFQSLAFINKAILENAPFLT